MRIELTSYAIRDLHKLPKSLQKRIAEKMRFYSMQPNPIKFAERLSKPAKGSFRFRIGDYRAVFDLIDGTIFILKIAKRDEVYGVV